MNPLLCPWEAPNFYIFSSNVPQLFFYSHGLVALFSISLLVLLFFKARNTLQGKLLIIINLAFCFWVLSDLIQWATNDPGTIIFFWSTSIFLETVIFILSVYFADVYFNKKDISNTKKIVLFILSLPVVVLLPTKYNLVGVYISVCNALEGPIATYYIYGLEIFTLLWIIVFSFRQFRVIKDVEFLKQTRFFVFGIIIFLLFFISGNIYSSISDNWVPAQYGLFGMPVFIGMLTYMIVRFKAFNLKLIGAQTLVLASSVMIGAQYFFIRTPVNRILNAITLAIVIGFGYVLVRSVEKEIDQRKHLEQVTDQLEKSKSRLEESNIKLEQANDKLKELDKLKTEFLALASHQLRSPLTAIKGYTSMLLDGDFGHIEDKQKEAVNRVFESSVHLTKVVEDLLNVSKIESGGMQYQKAPFDMEKAVSDLARDLAITAQKRNLTLTFSTDKKSPYTVNGDMEKITQVILNLIDNSIKYTKEGGISVKLSKDDRSKMISLAITDTGMGISAEEKEKLFGKFARGEGGKTNTGGSGLGLYLAKTIIEAHNGYIRIDSPGVGKGSTFTIELEGA